ncbi:MAG: hypothetical protein PHT58_03105 [Eubacteriales bacterium]|nr:hypothetical protein [Eubacteriales bacterium]
MARERKQYDDDDGRTIVDMNVEGMPWYDKSIRKVNKQKAKQELKEKIASGDALTTRETIRYTFYSILAALTVLGIVGGGCILFILFLLLIWR